MHRQLLAAISLCGMFLAAYLTLYHYGYVGTLACGTGGCETVQASRWAMFLGLPVALWGLGFYASVCAVATYGVVAGPDRQWPTTVLLALTGWGVAFSSWLTWLEIARIHAICRYCVGSALIAAALFVLAALDWRSRRTGAA
ncbi:MAG TPA: vitamin K epoxide reductase family protein [Gemmatimonadaceae bacterium]|nr:vitamin K epoxide reductase family protein [Gemmatimonadaceae bacterium]